MSHWRMYNGKIISQRLLYILRDNVDFGRDVCAFGIVFNTYLIYIWPWHQTLLADIEKTNKQESL